MTERGFEDLKQQQLIAFETVEAMRFSSVMLGATRVESSFYHNQISEECCRREGEWTERA
jgi:hypothetical protein